jgi:hypothetical protein
MEGGRLARAFRSRPFPRAVLLVSIVGLVGAAPASAARVSYRAEADDGPRKFFDSGGLELRGQCEGSSFGTEVDVTADTDFSDAMIHFNGQSGPPGESPKADYNQDDEFNPNDDVGLFAPEGEGGLGSDHAINSSGQIVYSRPGGVNVTVDWIADSSRFSEFGGEEDEPAPHGEAFDCIFVGHARVVSSGEERLNFRSGVIGNPVPVLDLGGMILMADCNPDNTGGTDPDDDPELSVTAIPKVSQSMMHFNGQFPGDQPSGDGHAFDFNDNLNVGGGGEPVFAVIPGRDSAGQIIFAKPGGVNTTVDWMAHEGDGLGGSNRCVFSGSARKRVAGDARRVNYRPNATGTQQTTFFKLGGLRLAGRCSGGMGGPSLFVDAISGSNHSVIHANAQSSGPEIDYGENDNFNEGIDDSVPMFGDLIVIGGPSPLLSETDQTSGQLIYSTEAGTHVVIDWLAEEVQGFSSTKPCAFVGTAEVSKP